MFPSGRNGFFVKAGSATKEDSPNHRRWMILLAGGSGERLAPLVRHIHPDDRPKQFATFIGKRSMLRHTFDRVGHLSTLHCVLTVLTSGQEEWAKSQLPSAIWPNFLVQPRNMGTGPAICLAIARVLAEDPQASVVILPSDHFIYPEERLEENLSEVLAACDEMREMKLILLGARTGAPSAGMDWIVPGDIRRFSDVRLYEVDRFAEKPPQPARRLKSGGALWNTFIVAGKARSFWYLLWRKHAEAARQMEIFHRDIREGRRPESAAARFSNVKPFDFCQDVLRHAAENLLVFPLQGIQWSDWETPEAVLDTIERMEWTERLERKLLSVAI